jgi:hypothetical protein
MLGTLSDEFALDCDESKNNFHEHGLNLDSVKLGYGLIGLTLVPMTEL